VRSAFVCGFVALIVAQVHAGEPKHTVRAITDAESVIAVYREDWGSGLQVHLRSFLQHGRTATSCGPVIA
jgi:hypothetical protein